MDDNLGRNWLDGGMDMAPDRNLDENCRRHRTHRLRMVLIENADTVTF